MRQRLLRFLCPCITVQSIASPGSCEPDVYVVDIAALASPSQPATQLGGVTAADGRLERYLADAATPAAPQPEKPTAVKESATRADAYPGGRNGHPSAAPPKPASAGQQEQQQQQHHHHQQDSHKQAAAVPPPSPRIQRAEGVPSDGCRDGEALGPTAPPPSGAYREAAQKAASAVRLQLAYAYAEQQPPETQPLSADSVSLRVWLGFAPDQRPVKPLMNGASPLVRLRLTYSQPERRQPHPGDPGCLSTGAVTVVRLRLVVAAEPQLGPSDPATAEQRAIRLAKQQARRGEPVPGTVTASLGLGQLIGQLGRQEVRPVGRIAEGLQRRLEELATAAAAAAASAAAASAAATPLLVSPSVGGAEPSGAATAAERARQHGEAGSASPPPLPLPQVEPAAAGGQQVEVAERPREAPTEQAEAVVTPGPYLSGAALSAAAADREAALRRQLDEAQARAESAESAVCQLERSCAALGAELAAARQLRAVAAAAAAVRNRKGAALRRAALGLAARRAVRERREGDAARERLAEARDKLTTKTAALADAQQQVDSLRARLQVANATAGRGAVEIARLRAELAGFLARVQELHRGAARSAEAEAVLKAEAAGLRAAVERLEAEKKGLGQHWTEVLQASGADAAAAAGLLREEAAARRTAAEAEALVPPLGRRDVAAYRDQQLAAAGAAAVVGAPAAAMRDDDTGGARSPAQAKTEQQQRHSCSHRPRCSSSTHQEEDFSRSWGCR